MSWRFKSPATRLNLRKYQSSALQSMCDTCPIFLFFFNRSRGAFITGKYAHRVGMQVSTSLLWRHNGLDGVSNHQPHDCLLNRLFRRKSKKASKPRVTGFCAGIHRWPVNSPHKWPVTRKIFSFYDIIIEFQRRLQHRILEPNHPPTQTFISQLSLDL